MEQTIKEVIDALEERDIEISKENMKHLLSQWITNLYSHIGTNAHTHAKMCGVEDETGMSWEEQDAYMLQQIVTYEDAVKALENGKRIKIKGFYVSRWDDGIEIVSEAEINLITREVVIGNHLYDYDFDTLDLEVLDCEYVTFYGAEYPCHQKEEADVNAYWYK